MFKFELNQLVEISISGETGHIKGRAEYSNQGILYQIHYKTVDGRAEEKWFDEQDLSAIEDDAHPGCTVYVARKEDLPDGTVIEE
jgi:hypothetical protein